MGVSEVFVKEILLRDNSSDIINSLIKKLTKTTKTTMIINLLIETILKLDLCEPISFNKKTVSKLTGLTERNIDELRRKKKLEFINLSGNNGVGRKIILYKRSAVRCLLGDLKHSK